MWSTAARGAVRFLAGEGVGASYLLRVDETLFADLFAAGGIDQAQQGLASGLLP